MNGKNFSKEKCGASLAKISAHQDRLAAEEAREAAFDANHVSANGGAWQMDQDTYNTIFKGGNSTPFGEQQ